MEQEKKSKYENHPSFMEGKWTGQGMARNISRTSYGNLEAAINAKKQYVKDLDSMSGIGEDHKESIYIQGMIAGLEEAVGTQEEE